MRDRDVDAQIIISGGGPVGMGLAIELGQRGIRVLVVERHPQPAPIPRGQNLTQRTMEHFRAWGVEAEVRAARTGGPIGGLTAYGTLLGDYAYDWMRRELVRPFYVTDNERLPQYRTEAVLRRRAAELPSVEILYGWTVDGVTQDGDGVQVSVAERGGDGRRTLRAEYAVGCDGSRSVVRDAAGITQTRSDHDRVMVLLVFRSAGLNRLLEKHPGKSFYSVLHPDLRGYWRFFGRVDADGEFFFHAPVPPGTTKDNYDFLGMLHEAAGAVFEATIDHIGFWDLRFAVADQYRAGRLFVAGDAAHSHPPYGGYGINTGLEDARNLGWKLAAVLQGWGGPALLESYDAERRPVFVSTAADFIEKSINTDRDFLATYDPARDRAAFETAWQARAGGAVGEVNAFEPNYEGSPVVFGPPGGVCSAVGHHATAARAGHHLTPQVLPDGRNVFDALEPGLTVLDFSTDGALRDRYGAPYVLVRPDEFVAWTGHEAPDAAILDRAAGRMRPGA